MTRPSNNFQFYRGDTKVFTLSFSNPDASPVDITGHTLWFTMKRTANDQDSEAVLQKRVMFPSTPASVAGSGSLLLDSTETSLIEPGIYLYDMQKVIPGNPPVVATFISGRIQVLPDITRRNG
ncbi:MAG: hypothetical protein HQL95_14320 [Magnetococcales bacterium]|nr:hypothetical protein [Magnetococcales bacterium]